MRFHYAWKTKTHRSFSTGVLLHGHTCRSKENLGFLPAVAEKTYGVLPSLLGIFEKRYERQFGTGLDYTRGYWTSPVLPEAAYALEAEQIRGRGLRPLVSLTDHDEIEGCRDIISLEWTAPYKESVFHIGIHNLPPGKAAEILKMLRAATAKALAARAHDPEKNDFLREPLAAVAAFPETLIVLNHPVTDQGRIGQEMLTPLLGDFLDRHAPWIHGLEVNALQPWLVNRRVVRIAKARGVPAVAGGDRHGFEPSGAINLTNASTFNAFAREVRDEKKSDILFMPQYREALAVRYGRQMEEILKDYPELGPRARWYDRVFLDCPDGVARSLTEICGEENPRLPRTAKRILAAIEIANLLAKPFAPAFEKIRSSSLEPPELPF